MPTNDLEQAIHEAYLHTKEKIDFTKKLWIRSVDSQNKIRPRFYQGSRIYEMVENGTNRVVCADTTSAGKTLTAVIIKALMDEKYKELKSRRAKALVIAPNQALDSAWTNYEINTYTDALQLSKQRSINITERGDLGNLVDNIHKHDFILVNYDKFSIRPVFSV